MAQSHTHHHIHFTFHFLLLTGFYSLKSRWWLGKTSTTENIRHDLITLIHFHNTPLFSGFSQLIKTLKDVVSDNHLI